MSKEAGYFEGIALGAAVVLNALALRGTPMFKGAEILGASLAVGAMAWRTAKIFSENECKQETRSFAEAEASRRVEAQREVGGAAL